MRLVMLVLIATACGRVSFDPVEGTELRVEFTRDATHTDEAAGTVSIAVQLSAPSTDHVTVAFETASGTATVNTDFTGATTGTLVFAAGETERTIVLDITADSEVEPDETFDVTLRAPTNATLGAATHTVTISATILPRVNFVLAASEASEASQSVVTVALDIPSLATVSVDYLLDGREDFELRSGTLTFEPGETVHGLPLGEVQDLLDEDDEAVEISLHSPVNAVVGAAANHTHIIVDDDERPLVGVTIASQLVEAAGEFDIGVTLSAASGRTVSVIVVRAEGSVGEADVGFEPTIVTFAPGETSKVIGGTVISDLLDEDPELFNLGLAQAVNANIEGVGVSTTIIDDDPEVAVAFDGPLPIAGENAGTASIALRLSAPSGKTISVPFSIDGNGTTASGSDFALVTASPVVFEPGTVEKLITISIANDDLDEPDETVEIDLGTPISATFSGVSSSRTFTITDDDDAPALTLAQDFVSTLEGDNGTSTVVIITVSLSAPSGRTVTVDLDTSASTAALGTDFSITGMPVTFAPGDTSEAFEIQIEGDNQPEPDESVAMSLTNATNAVITPIDLVHVITDDD